MPINLISSDMAVSLIHAPWDAAMILSNILVSGKRGRTLRYFAEKRAFLPCEGVTDLNFYGTSENAVKTQIWIAVAVYVLVAIVRERLGIEAPLYIFLQVLSLTLLEPA